MNINYESLMKKLNQNSNIPYPSVPKLYPNKQYANLVFNDFAGDFGELTAIAQYVYQHLDLDNQKDISKILLKIAMEEMRHLDILGKIIVALGEKPRYINSDGKKWSSSIINYNTCDFVEMMGRNIYAEQTAIDGYRRLIRYTNNMALRRVYERIILDEQVHKEVFTILQNTAKEAKNCN